MTLGQRTLTGVGIGRGAVYGPVARVHAAPKVPVEEKPLPDRRWARKVVLQAFAEVAESLAIRAAGTTGPMAAKLDAAAQMAADPALHAEVLGGIDTGEAPAHAVDRVIDGFCTMFLNIGGSAAERVADLRAVRDRVVARLLGEKEPGIPVLAEASVVVAEDLAPGETAALDQDKVLAIVTEQGGPTSHTSIVASQLGIPCVVRVAGIEELVDGRTVAVDAATGTVTLDPDASVRHQHDERAAILRDLAADRTPGATRDGHRVALMANIGSVSSALRALETGVEGVGLFRTEGLFLERGDPPGVEEQAVMYSSVLKMFGSGKVVVRTIDSVAERTMAPPGATVDRNPALGVRGYRLVRTHPDLLHSQLAALARAQERSDRQVWVMAPMVTTPVEARDFAAMAESHGLSTIGVMVEVPAAALRAEQLLSQVDFAALGTNDLAQYTMAVDRLCGDLADLLDLWEPAVLDLVAKTAWAGERLGKPVTVCGESAADPLMALVLVGLGAASLSMSPSGVATVRYALRHHSLSRCREMAAAALAAPSASEARAAVAGMLDATVRGLLAIPPR